MRIRATLHLKNDAMISARRKLGYSQADVAKLAGVSPAFYGSLECLKYPKNRTQFIKDAVSEIADILNLDEEQVFPVGVEGIKIETVIRVTDVTANSLRDFRGRQKRLVSNVEEEMYGEDIKVLILKSFEHLTFREKEILRLKYGLNCKEHSYSQIAQLFGVAHASIQQNHDKAIRKLKDPKKTRHNSEIQKLDGLYYKK